MSLVQNLAMASADAVSVGLGSYIAVLLFSPDAVGANVNLFGYNVNLAVASAMAGAAMVIFDEFVYKMYLRSWLDRFPMVQRLLDSGSFVGQGVVLGLLPAMLIYASNMDALPLSGALLLGASSWLGATGGRAIANMLIDPVLGGLF